MSLNETHVKYADYPKSSIYNGAYRIKQDDSNPRYNICTDLIPEDCQQYGGSESYEIDYATNKQGDYIGDLKDAQVLCDELGIWPVPRSPISKQCCIGKSDKDGKWYGWSHRALYGFTIGSEVKKGSCAYKPQTREEYIEQQLEFWGDNGDAVVVQKGGELYIDRPLDTNPRKLLTKIEFIPERFGRGEWLAKTDEDAKQMASDFAESVSSGRAKEFEKYLSISTATPVEYSWFKLTAGKHAGSVYGLRWYRNKIYIVTKDNLNEKLIDEARAQQMVRFSKGFTGKIGKEVVKEGSQSFFDVIKQPKKVKVLPKIERRIPKAIVPALIREHVEQETQVTLLIVRTDLSPRGWTIIKDVKKSNLNSVVAKMALKKKEHYLIRVVDTDPTVKKVLSSDTAINIHDNKVKKLLKLATSTKKIHT